MVPEALCYMFALLVLTGFCSWNHLPFGIVFLVLLSLSFKHVLGVPHQLKV